MTSFWKQLLGYREHKVTGTNPSWRKFQELDRITGDLLEQAQQREVDRMDSEMDRWQEHEREIKEAIAAAEADLDADADLARYTEAHKADNGAYAFTCQRNGDFLTLRMTLPAANPQSRS